MFLFPTRHYLEISSLPITRALSTCEGSSRVSGKSDAAALNLANPHFLVNITFGLDEFAVDLKFMIDSKLGNAIDQKLRDLASGEVTQNKLEEKSTRKHPRALNYPSSATAVKRTNYQPKFDGL